MSVSVYVAVSVPKLNAHTHACMPAGAKNTETVQILPVLFGFFVPYKLASLRPAFVSLPPLRPNEVRVFRSSLLLIPPAPPVGVGV